MKEIYGSAQQTLSKARQQAIKNKYPYYIFITSTPNGIEGPGEWFYNRWYNAVDEDLVFNYNKETNVDDWKQDIDLDKIIMDPNKNTFIKIQYHWSEDPSKNEHWYQEQCQELSDQRKINQELDLMFVGSTNCIFDDDTLANFKEEEPKQTIQTPNGAQLKIFTDNIDTSDYFIIGCDTAESLTGAYCALQIFSFRNFIQVAELTHKYGSFTAYGQDIDFTFRWLYKIAKNRIILNIENNTIGKAVLEHLLFHIEDFDYRPFLYRDDLGKHSDQYGTKTTGLTKPLMVGCLIEFLNDNPQVQKIKSKELIGQFGTIERTNSGTIRSTGYSDLFMATCFCAYLRKKKALEILPMVHTDPQEYENKLVNEFKQIISLSNPKIDNSKQLTTLDDALMGYMYENDDIESGDDNTFGFFG